MTNAHLNAGNPQFYRSVFLSDFHIGAKSFDAAALVSFLRSFECDRLYLVGDIIDGWKLHKRWYWTEDCNRVFDELAAKLAKGTKVIFLPGNHDEEVRRLPAFIRKRFADRADIEITDKTIHETYDGRRFLVLHGDQFDRKILRGRLSQWSDRIYDAVMDFMGGHNPPTVMVKGQPKRFSLAKSLSKHGQWALHLLNNFENAVYKMTTSKDVDGLICGHTHIPVIKPIRDIIYANCGSWLRSGHTALIETPYGELELIDWPASHENEVATSLFEPHPASFTISPDRQRYRETTNMVVRAIQKTWPVQDGVIRPAITQPLEWIEINQRDNVLYKRFAGLKSYALCKPKHFKSFEARSIRHRMSALLTYKPDMNWEEDLRHPLNFYETFITPSYATDDGAGNSALEFEHEEA
ncbi:MAG: UDP-2,3-diacylglucosamine diphosphatase [Alphaproteobacteria bacterium]|nr:UDP-2,3-diacylglucosamine diphosphatase [Alphaproteobacteria bacterium]